MIVSRTTSSLHGRFVKDGLSPLGVDEGEEGDARWMCAWVEGDDESSSICQSARYGIGARSLEYCTPISAGDLGGNYRHLSLRADDVAPQTYLISVVYLI